MKEIPTLFMTDNNKIDSIKCANLIYKDHHSELTAEESQELEYYAKQKPEIRDIMENYPGNEISGLIKSFLSRDESRMRNRLFGKIRKPRICSERHFKACKKVGLSR